MRSFAKFFTLAVLVLICSSCASRGYYLSQQIPGYDNHLQPLPLNISYNVNAQGQISDVQKLSPHESERNVAGVTAVDGTAPVASTLDPVRGAMLIGH